MTSDRRYVLPSIECDDVSNAEVPTERTRARRIDNTADKHVKAVTASTRRALSYSLQSTWGVTCNTRAARDPVKEKNRASGTLMQKHSKTVDASSATQERVPSTNHHPQKGDHQTQAHNRATQQPHHAHCVTPQSPQLQRGANDNTRPARERLPTVRGTPQTDGHTPSRQHPKRVDDRSLSLGPRR